MTVLLCPFAEHNGAYSAAFKNILDWVSRMEGSVWADKPVFALATSPGKRGGTSVLEIATNRIPFNGGKVVAQFSLPSFNNSFSAEEGILDADLKDAFYHQLAIFAQSL